MVKVMVRNTFRPEMGYDYQYPRNPVPRNIFDVFFEYHGLPEHRNKRKSVLEITKMYYFKI